jgi:hypothetical protein
MGSVSACLQSVGLGLSCRKVSFEQLGQALAGPARPPALGGVGPGDEAAGEGVEAGQDIRLAEMTAPRSLRTSSAAHSMR